MKAICRFQTFDGDVKNRSTVSGGGRQFAQVGDPSHRYPFGQCANLARLIWLSPYQSFLIFFLCRVIFRMFLCRKLSKGLRWIRVIKTGSNLSKSDLILDQSDPTIRFKLDHSILHHLDTWFLVNCDVLLFSSLDGSNFGRLRISCNAHVAYSVDHLVGGQVFWYK